ncbi:MAG: iron complex transport system permease protein [Clostridiales bacterium]|jgi:iron complex transport system permease protein|nr:iron complex transport system permease protein [Clostridiales bacterium]
MISVCIALLPFAAMLAALFLGRYPISFIEVLQRLWLGITTWHYDVQDVVAGVIFQIRLPRAILGFFVGGALAVSGAVLQGIFRNPLVDAGMLGVSNGASFGAVLGFIFFNGRYGAVILLAFSFGLLAVWMSYRIASAYRSTPTIMLVLGGVIVSSVFSALVSFGKYIADPYDELPGIVFWLMGSLANTGYRELMIAIFPISISFFVIYLMRWRMNVLSLGDLEAFSLGVNIRRTKGILIACSALMTAAAVAVSGTIGWIGLVMPHMIRMLIGSDYRTLLPLSFALGGGFLVIVDIFARSISSAEMPIGIITALVGAPFYVFLLRRTKGRNW